MDRQKNCRRFGYYFNFCIYSIILSFYPSIAQQAPSNTNIAGPSASATGSVTNQAVQVLQGPFAVNTYGSGVSCQGPTFSITPFVFGNVNSSLDPETFQSQTGNFGVSASWNIPLDGSLNELCKKRVETEILRQQAEADKARLDFELVRLLKCGEAKKAGIDFNPQSPYAKICSDIVVKTK